MILVGNYAIEQLIHFVVLSATFEFNPFISRMVY